MTNRAEEMFMGGAATGIDAESMAAAVKGREAAKTGAKVLGIFMGVAAVTAAVAGAAILKDTKSRQNTGPGAKTL